MKSVTPYLYLSLFVFINIINFVDRNILLAFAVDISREFNLSETQWGFLSGGVFLIFYSIFGIFMGLLGDRFNRSKIISVGIVVWSIMTWLTGKAQSFGHLLFARLFIGAGESTLSPNALSILGDLFPKKVSGIISGVYYLGIPIGVSLAFIISGQLGPIFGWRSIFITLGIIGAILGLLVFFLKEPQRGLQETKKNNILEQYSFSQIFTLTKETLRNSRSLMLVIVGAVFLHIPLGAGAFETKWGVEVGFSDDYYKTAFGSMFLVGGIVGAVAGGLLIDILGRIFNRGPMYILTLSYIILTPLIVGYRFIPIDSIFFYICMFFVTVNVTFFYGPVFRAVNELTPFRVKTTMIAVFILSVNLIGMFLGSILPGILIDNFLYSLDKPVTWALVITGSFGIISILCFYLSSFSYKKDLENASN